MSFPVGASIVVPAYKENGNLRPLVTRIINALSQPGSPVGPNDVEILIVDDNSRDGSVETVEALRREGYPVRIIVRTNERGLSSAVVRGFREAQGEKMLCMDADLQVRIIAVYNAVVSPLHPPSHSHFPPSLSCDAVDT